jgi:WD40 repeat protein
MIARAGELGAQAQNLRQNELQLSLLMSVEAYRKSDIFQTRKLLLSSSQTPVELIGFYGQQGSNFSGASMAISPDGKIIATGGDGEWIMLWHTENRKPISSVPAIYNGLIRSMAFSPDGRILAAAQNNSILLWDIVSASQIAVLYSDAPLIDHVAFSSDGKILAASGNDGAIYFWDVKTIEFLDFLPSSIDIVGAHIAFSPDGKWLISISTECDYSKNPTECNPKILFLTHRVWN